MKKWISMLAATAVLAASAASVPMAVSAAGKGDVNNDGLVNTGDVRAILIMTTKELTPTTKQLYWGDYNVNGAIDTSDARELLEETLTLIDTTAPKYNVPTTTDCWGDRSISLLGDSISFGVGASDPIPENSYVGLVKKAIKNANGGNLNYGFTSSYPTSWQANNRADEVHMWPTYRSQTDGAYDWVCDGDENGNRLVSVAQTAKKHWATISYTLREEYASEFEYFCVYYHTAPNNGQFIVSNVVDGIGYDQTATDGTVIYDCENTVEETKRTAFYKLSDFTSGNISIVVHSNDNTPVSITGIGYYKDISEDAITFNSYTRGGISLVNMSDKVLDQAASSETMILALGLNDAIFNTDRVNNGEFKNRIDYLINAVNKNGTQLIVNDYCWDNPQFYTDRNYSQESINLINETRLYVKSELRRLADETNGIYIDQPALLGQAINDDLNSEKADGIHPTSAGHAMIAANVIEALGLS